ncbi:hypothetical protein HZC08_02025 [Candidatus Micrarchaeota archaeon]|nr:hypothetical protein [Candidatus Micrarchaeota archaeon]
MTVQNKTMPNPLGSASRQAGANFSSRLPLTEPSALHRNSFSAMSDRLASKKGVSKEAAALELTRDMVEYF